MTDTRQGKTASRPVVVRVFASSPSSGCAESMTWEKAAEAIFQHIFNRFGSQVSFEFIQLFSQKFFQFPKVMALIQDGSAQVPVISVDDIIIQNGGKISERAIREALVACGLTDLTTI